MPKTLSFLLILTIISFKTFAQALENTVVIVACKNGSLFVDGTLSAELEGDDAKQIKLTFGEHYLQLKTATEKFNASIKVDENFKEIVRLGCAAIKQTNAVKLIDKQLNLSGILVNELEQNIIGLDKDDEIILNCSVLNKKGTANISIKEYTHRTEIYKKEKFNLIENDRIKVPIKGIYIINLNTDALFGKDAKLIIERVPSPNSSPNFKTTVKRVLDTVNKEVLTTITRVYSVTNGSHQNTTTIKINLPEGTTYWTYWIGVGQESRDKMKNFTATLSNAGSLLSLNPLVLFGMKLIPSLPMLNATSTVNYRFMDTQNSQLFMAKQNYSYFKFKYADHISTDYAFVNLYVPDLVLCFTNESTFNGEDVEIRVVAFQVKSKLILEE